MISGPSGVGKTTISRQVLQRTGAVFSVSATTRPRRNGERDGRDYVFLDVDAFRRMIAEGDLLEWAQVFGNYYGTPAGPVQTALDDGSTVLLEIDVQGGIQVAGRRPDVVGILVLPPDEMTLSRRLSGRGLDGPEEMAERLAKARAEIDTARQSGAYKREVINDDLAETVDLVVAIVEKETQVDD